MKYNEQLYANMFNNLDEMDKFLKNITNQATTQWNTRYE